MTTLDERSEKYWLQDQEIEHVLRAIIPDRIFVDDKFLEQLNELVNRLGDKVYSALLFLLCRQSFDNDEAKLHWIAVVDLHSLMAKKLGESIDIRLALVSYFLQDKNCFERPALIDLAFFEKIQDSVYKDELTGLYNYRYLKAHLEQELQRAQRYNSIISVVMMDIDDFKYFNDHHGHEAGNRMLTKLACILQDSIRGIDTAIRYGGEEFVLTLPGTNKEGAYMVYERIQKTLREDSLEYANEQPLGFLSVSAGIATYPIDTSDAGELLQRADNAMYIAKNLGKNQVHVYGENRRSHLRVKTQLQGSYSIGHPDERNLLNVHDISENGMLVIIDEAIPVGIMLNVLIDFQDDEQPLSYPARVIRTEIMDDGHYQLGLGMVQMPTQDRMRLQKYLDKCRTE